MANGSERTALAAEVAIAVFVLTSAESNTGDGKTIYVAMTMCIILFFCTCTHNRNCSRSRRQVGGEEEKGSRDVQSLISEHNVKHLGEPSQ